MTRSLAWLRRDLRVQDNPVLATAVTGGQASVLYVDDRYLLDRWRLAGKRLAFLEQALEGLAKSLAAAEIPFGRVEGDPVDAVVRAAVAERAEVVFAARDFSPYARRRDARVAEALAAHGVELRLLDGVLVSRPDEMLTAAGTPIQRFAAFKRRWMQLPLPARNMAGARPAGAEAAALNALDRWAKEGLDHYAARRDRLDRDATSHMSAALRWGLVSPRDALEATAGEPAFASELCWREFAYHVAAHFSVGSAGSEPSWRTAPDELEAWREGRTGYPIVDAAMRQLRATGFMHNRARMIVASLLTKHLLIDWREGAEHFMQHLVDGDWAVNRYNWQWVASVGVDASPYFRVMNPVTQAKRFDPSGAYVRLWVPELEHLKGAAIHEPWRADAALRRHYPAPIVDLAAGRARALGAFRVARG